MRQTGEPRRGARIAASFWVGIEGIDSQPSLRQGNLSASGMYFETVSEVGPSGSVQFLHLESEDRRVIVQVLARIIRVTNIDDLVHGRSIGLALEFMPATQEGRKSLERLVRHVVECGLRQEGVVDHAFDVQLSGEHQTDRTTLQHLSVQKLVLETDWRAQVGDQLQFQISGSASRGGTLPLDGLVTAVNPAEEGYRVEVRVTGLSQPRGEAQPQNLSVFTELIAHSSDDFELPAPEHLSGVLSRIKPPTLLGLMELERFSGELRFSNEQRQEVCLYVRDGRPVDALGDPKLGSSPRELIAAMMSWTEGQFNFSLESVEREDRLGTSMTSLVLDLAREEDEASQEIDMRPEGGDFF